MRVLNLILLLSTIFIIGCVTTQYPNALYKRTFCNLDSPIPNTNCPRNGGCYFFKDFESKEGYDIFNGSICWIGNPCDRCPSKQCDIMESAPPQVVCSDRQNEVPITDQKQCEAIGGRWEKIFAYPEKWFCNSPTTDAGKQCRDDDDCQGLCLVPISKEDLVKINTRVGTDYQQRKETEKQVLSKYTSGKCDEWVSNQDCLYTFNDGQIIRGPCP